VKQIYGLLEAIHVLEHRTAGDAAPLRENLGAIMEIIRADAVGIVGGSRGATVAGNRIARIARELLTGLEYGVDGNGHTRKVGLNGLPACLLGADRQVFRPACLAQTGRSHGLTVPRKTVPMISPADKSIQSVLAGRAESYRLEDSVTPRGHIAEGIAAVVNAWNECIPRERVRVMSVGRVVNVRCLLHRFTADQVIRAIRCYGKAPWQRANNAWKRFDNAMSEAFIVEDRKKRAPLTRGGPITSWWRPSRTARSGRR
jgi:hypothetical protein